MIPTPEEVGEEARLDLTFPDGTEAVVTYPADLELATMGVQPDVDLGWRGDFVGAIVFTSGGPERRLLGGHRPLELYERDGRAIEEWKAQPRGGRHRLTDRWLVIRLPSWTVHVPLKPRTDPEAVIELVRPYEADNGFVAIDVSPPAELAEGYGDAGGPQLAFGDLDPLPDFVRPSDEGLLINVAPSDCRGVQPSVQIEGSYGSACLEGELFVNATSFSDTSESRQKLAEIVEGLRVLDFEPAG